MTLLRFLAFAVLALHVTSKIFAQLPAEISGPPGSVAFGNEVVFLPNGNVVVTDPQYGVPGGPAAVGAVYLYEAGSYDLISTLTGSTANDFVGADFFDPTAVNIEDTVRPGIVVLPEGNFLVRSTNWSNQDAARAGAVTFVDGATGLSGAVSASNSLVGSSMNDQVGTGIHPLPGGGCVVAAPFWDHGGIADVGAVTFLASAMMTVGEVSPANALIGTSAEDRVGRVTLLANGHYVVLSNDWHDSGGNSIGAVTWCDGDTGTVGPVSAANSLVGRIPSFPGFNQGGFSVYALTNGNYVVVVRDLRNQGSVTWVNGSAATSDVIGPSNSLIDSEQFDQVGSGGIIALPSGNYLALSNAQRAVTFGDGVAPITGQVSTSNSLISTGFSSDLRVEVLSNGDYLVINQTWGPGDGPIGFSDGVGAVTWGSGETGVSGMVSSENSLIGSQPGDEVGSGGVTPLTNGHYVVNSPKWSDGDKSEVGAATFVRGGGPIVGTVNATNSLIGSTPEDHVGFVTTALSNGNYVVGSPDWDRQGVPNVGAATFASGTDGIIGVVDETNSLVGSTANDQVGGMLSGFQGPMPIGLITVSDGPQVLLRSPFWDNGPLADAGAVTLVDASAEITGEISAVNSLVGASAGDQVGFLRSLGNGRLFDTVKPLASGAFLLASPAWDNCDTARAGAVTVVGGSEGIPSMISALNSFVGTTENQSFGLETFVDDSNGVALVRNRQEQLLIPLNLSPEPCPLEGPTDLTIEFHQATNEITLRWQAVAGQRYAIDTSPSLPCFSMPPFEEIVASSANATLTFPRPTESSMFFRVRDMCGPVSH